MKTVERSFSRKLRYVIIYVVIVAAVGILFLRMPTSYVPDEDQGIMLAQIMLPTGSTLEQTKKVAETRSSAISRRTKKRRWNPV